jgi:hypothetical protein
VHSSCRVASGRRHLTICRPLRCLCECPGEIGHYGCNVTTYVIELTRQITAHTATEAEMAERSSLANKALKAFVDLAGQRIRNESPSGPAKRVGDRDARSSGGC